MLEITFQTLTPTISKLSGLQKIKLKCRIHTTNLNVYDPLVAIHFGLCRHIKVSRPEVDIINRAHFTETNRIFTVKITELKRNGKRKVDHKPPIAVVDLQKLSNSSIFDQKTPVGLQNKVWFEIMVYFC